jgi:carboxypeptidase Taq
MSTQNNYTTLVRHLQRCRDIAGALRLLEWDQETYLPDGAVESRASQIGALSEVLHEQHTAPHFLDLVDELAERLGELSFEQAVDVRETKWQLDRERALDAALVRERSEQRATARSVWIKARRDDNFAALAPHLEKIVAMERRVAAAIDATRDPYEVLLEAYEPGLRLDRLETVLGEVRAGLQPLVARIRAVNERAPWPASPLLGDFAEDKQLAFNRQVLTAIGFDFANGRIDASAHPFSTTIGSDSRLTTRYDRSDLGYALYSSLHEAGHGMYEQGLDPQARGLPRGSACSLGVHESQSRLWENQIGRSRAFWDYLLPVAKQAFPALAPASVDAVCLAVNRMEPSFIRTESDEATYNLHILLRFELERALIGGDLHVGDLAQAWREKMRDLLGVVPPDDRQGVLQDVHWSAGEFGYFPTYTLGNLYAAQLLETAATELGDIDAVVRAGEFSVLLCWMRDRIHRWGQTWRAAELIERATGSAASAAPLLRHLERKVEWLEQR